MNNKFLIYSFLTLTVLSTLHEKRGQTGRFIASDMSAQIELLEEKICEQKSMLEKLQESVENMMSTMTTFMASLPPQTDQNLYSNVNQLTPTYQGQSDFDRLRASYASSSYFAMAAKHNANYYANNVSGPTTLEKATLQYQIPSNTEQAKKYPLYSEQVKSSFEEYQKRQFNFSETTPIFEDNIKTEKGKVPTYKRSNASVPETTNS